MAGEVKRGMNRAQVLPKSHTLAWDTAHLPFALTVFLSVSEKDESW